jgi:hypothetical protein
MEQGHQTPISLQQVIMVLEGLQIHMNLVEVGVVDILEKVGVRR